MRFMGRFKPHIRTQVLFVLPREFTLISEGVVVWAVQVCVSAFNAVLN